MNARELDLACVAIDALGPTPHTHDSPLLVERDRLVAEFLREYATATSVTQAEMRSLFERRHSGPLHSFTLRMALLGLRERARTKLLLGLLAIAVDDCRVDYREVLMTVTPVHDAARRIAVDPVALFDEAAESAAQDTADLLRGFPRRPPELQSLNVMGWRLEETADGPTYLFGWPKTPKNLQSREPGR